MIEALIILGVIVGGWLLFSLIWGFSLASFGIAAIGARRVDSISVEVQVEKQLQSLRAFMGDSFVDNNRELIDRAIADLKQKEQSGKERQHETRLGDK
jgi:hypothetical protein